MRACPHTHSLLHTLTETVRVCVCGFESNGRSFLVALSKGKSASVPQAGGNVPRCFRSADLPVRQHTRARGRRVDRKVWISALRKDNIPYHGSKLGGQKTSPGITWRVCRVSCVSKTKCSQVLTQVLLNRNRAWNFPVKSSKQLSARSCIFDFRSFFLFLTL